MAIDKRIKNCQEDTFNGTVICILSNIGYEGVEQNINVLAEYIKTASKQKWYVKEAVSSCAKLLIGRHRDKEEYCKNINEAVRSINGTQICEVLHGTSDGSSETIRDEQSTGNADEVSSLGNEDAIREAITSSGEAIDSHSGEIDISSIPQELIIEALRKKQKQQDGLFVAPIGVIDESFDPYNLNIISEYTPEQIREETEEFNRRRIEEEPEVEDQIDIFGGIDETES
jgi:hypothetical protein